MNEADKQNLIDLMNEMYETSNDCDELQEKSEKLMGERNIGYDDFMSILQIYREHTDLVKSLHLRLSDLLDKIELRSN